jgi:hypothetical protein
LRRWRGEGESRSVPMHTGGTWNTRLCWG